MIPDNVLSSKTVISAISGAKQRTISLVEDFDDGGIALYNTSEGFLYQEWSCRIVNVADIVLSAPNTQDTIIYSGNYISEVSITFDQNMNPVVAFVEDGEMKLRWYDSSIQDYAVTLIPGRNPRVLLDDKRAYMISQSDVLLFYILGENLFMRSQRDRFMDAYNLYLPITNTMKLRTVGMGRHYRVQLVFG